MGKNKQQVITFKANAALVDAISNVPNRSEFIREAVLAALNNVCPLCNGTGQLSPSQKSHWKEFMSDHLLEKCSNCHEVHLVCGHTGNSRKQTRKDAQ